MELSGFKYPMGPVIGFNELKRGPPPAPLKLELCDILLIKTSATPTSESYSVSNL
jgi:hypothetical protein